MPIARLRAGAQALRVDLSPEIQLLVAAQDGLLHRSQAYSLGMSRARMRWWVARGHWRFVLPAVFATFTGALSTRQRLLAATLYAGPGTQITGAAALRLYGVRCVPVDAYVRILVPHGRQLRCSGWVRPQRTRRMDPQPKRIDPLTVVSVPRAVLDAARLCASERPVQSLVTEVLQRGFCTIGELQNELVAGPRQHSAFLRRVLSKSGRAAKAPPPSGASDLFASSRILPPVSWQTCLHAPDGRVLPSPNGWIPEVDLGIEIDPGGRYTATDGWGPGPDPHVELALHGAVVLRFTHAQLRADPIGVLRTVEHTYVDRLRRGVRGTLVAAQPVP